MVIKLTLTEEEKIEALKQYVFRFQPVGYEITECYTALGEIVLEQVKDKKDDTTRV